MKAPLQIKVLGELAVVRDAQELSCLRQRRPALCLPTWLWPTGDNVATIYAKCSGTRRMIPELRSGGASRSLGGCSTKTVMSPASGPMEAACFSTPTSLTSICSTLPTLPWRQRTDHWHSSRTGRCHAHRICRNLSAKLLIFGRAKSAGDIV